MKKDLFLMAFKHVFVDVIDFTRSGRPVEEQVGIVSSLNAIVRRIENELLFPYQYVILPTGDGMCISMLVPPERDPPVPADLHLQVALAILRGVDEHNVLSASKGSVQFELRTGVSEAVDDCLVTDITGSLNVIGSGINLAQRVMNGADAKNILVTEAVRDLLVKDPTYEHSFLKYLLADKHHVLHVVYLFTAGAVGTSSAKPDRVYEDPGTPTPVLFTAPTRPIVVRLYATSFEGAQNERTEIPITELTTLAYVCDTPTLPREYVFYFHVLTDAGEKGWIGFCTPPHTDLSTPAERTRLETELEGPRIAMNVRALARKRWPEFRGSVMRINRMRLRGSLNGNHAEGIVTISEQPVKG